MKNAAIVVGEGSSMAVIRKLAALLRALSAPYVIKMFSHNEENFAEKAAAWVEKENVGVIIAANGTFSRSDEIIAAHTAIPVIGLPTDNCFGSGLDSFLTARKLRNPVPVIKVLKNDAENAASLAVSILRITEEC